ncbi:MAG: GNAT family N-acetyltransferase [Pseudomonadota bacterium]
MPFTRHPHPEHLGNPNEFQIIKAPNGFEAEITLFPHEPLTSIQITGWPEKDSKQTLREFHEFMQTQYGGKLVFRYDGAEQYEMFQQSGFEELPPEELDRVHCIEYKKLHEAIEAETKQTNMAPSAVVTLFFQQHPRLRDYEKLFDVMSCDSMEHAAAAYAFKAKHAPTFVTPEKAQKGIYGTIPEFNKSQHPSAHAYLVTEKDSGEIVGSILYMQLDPKTLYITDFIVHNEKRSNGMGAHLLSKSLVAFLETMPDLRVGLYKLSQGGKSLLDHLDQKKLGPAIQAESQLFFEEKPEGPVIQQARQKALRLDAEMAAEIAPEETMLAPMAR